MQETQAGHIAQISTPKLFDALAKAQSEFPVIPKDSEVEVKKESKFLYKYKYADLTTIIDCTRPSMTKHGLSFTQTYCKMADLGTGIITIIQHNSGEVLKTGFVPCTIESKTDMKFVGGQFTFGKRISLTAALGISADEDMDAAGDDGKDGNSTEKKRGPAITPRAKGSTPHFDHDDASFDEATMPDAPNASYKIPFGQYKGRTLDSFQPDVLRAYCIHLEDKAKSDGVEITRGGAVDVFLNEALDYLNMISGR